MAEGGPIPKRQIDRPAEGKREWCVFDLLSLHPSSLLQVRYRRRDLFLPPPPVSQGATALWRCPLKPIWYRKPPPFSPFSLLCLALTLLPSFPPCCFFLFSFASLRLKGKRRRGRGTVYTHYHTTGFHYSDGIRCARENSQLFFSPFPLPNREGGRSRDRV